LPAVIPESSMEVAKHLDDKLGTTVKGRRQQAR